MKFITTNVYKIQVDFRTFSESGQIKSNPPAHSIGLGLTIYLLWETVFHEVEVEIADPGDVNSHHPALHVHVHVVSFFSRFFVTYFFLILDQDSGLSLTQIRMLVLFYIQ